MNDAPADVIDDFLIAKIAEAERDAETVGLLLHGSRAGGIARDDSDYDLICVLTQDGFDLLPASAIHQKVTATNGLTADVLYQPITRLTQYIAEPGWYTATYLSARILFDRTGELATALEHMRSESGRFARDNAAEAYDAYLNSFVRSIKSARRGDNIGRQLHAAESGMALTRALFGLESTWPPYHDGLAEALSAIETAQGWPSGYLGKALIRLTRDADPAFQQQLEQQVERLMESRGIHHEWGTDLEPLKTLRLGSD